MYEAIADFHMPTFVCVANLPTSIPEHQTSTSQSPNYSQTTQNGDENNAPLKPYQPRLQTTAQKAPSPTQRYAPKPTHNPPMHPKLTKNHQTPK